MSALSLLRRTPLAPAAGRVEPERLVARHATFLLRYVVLRLGDGPEAEDAVAETFAAALNSLSRFPQPAPDGADDDPARAYLVGIARRKVADALRKQGRESPLSPTLRSPSDPAREMVTEDEAARVRALLASLPDAYREVLLLKYADGLSLIEIGIALGKSPNAVGQLLHRARALARKRGADLFSEEDFKP